MQARQLYLTDSTRTRVAFCSAGVLPDLYKIKLSFITVEDNSKSIVFELYYDAETSKYVDPNDSNVFFSINGMLGTFQYKASSSYVTSTYSINYEKSTITSITAGVADPSIVVNGTEYTANKKGYLFEYHHSKFIDDEGNAITPTYDDSQSIESKYRRAIKMPDTTYAKDIEAVRQYLLQHLSVMKHELWYNYEYGLPLMQEGLTKAMVDAEVALIISECRYIESVTRFDSYIDDSHVYHLSFEVMTTYGKLEMIDTL